jgi:hypothetical protein
VLYIVYSVRVIINGAIFFLKRLNMERF